MKNPGNRAQHIMKMMRQHLNIHIYIWWASQDYWQKKWKYHLKNSVSSIAHYKNLFISLAVLGLVGACRIRCLMQYLLLWSMGSVLMMLRFRRWNLSSLTRKGTLIFCIARWSLNHWTTKVVLVHHLLSEGGEEIYMHTHSFSYFLAFSKQEEWIMGEILGRSGNERQKQERKWGFSEYILLESFEVGIKNYFTNSKKRIKSKGERGSGEKHSLKIENK